MGRRWTCSCPWASPAPARKSPASAPRPSTSLRLAVLALPETCLGKRDGRTGGGSAGLGACLGMLDVRGIGFESLVSRVALGDSRALPQRSLILSPGEAGPLEDLGPLSIQSAEQVWKRGVGGRSTGGWGKARGSRAGWPAPPLQRLPAPDVALELRLPPEWEERERGCRCVFIDREDGMGRRSNSSRGPGFSSVVTAAQKAVGAPKYGVGELPPASFFLSEGGQAKGRERRWLSL